MQKSSNDVLESIKKEAYAIRREAIGFSMLSSDKDKANEALKIMHDMATVIAQIDMMK